MGLMRISLMLATIALMVLSWRPGDYRYETACRSAALVCAVWLYWVVRATEESKRKTLLDNIRELRIITESLTVQNERLLKTSERAPPVQSDVLLNMYRALANTVDLQQLLHIFLARLKDLVPYQAAAVFLYGEDRTDLSVAAVQGLHQDAVGNQLGSDVGLPAIVARSGTAMIISNARHDPRLTRLWERLASAAYLPLKLAPETFGTVCLWSDDENRYSAETDRLLAPVCTEAARAIKNAEMHEEKEKRLAFLMKLWEISRHLTQSVDPSPDQVDTLLDDVLDGLQTVFSASQSLLFGWSAEDRMLVPRRSRNMPPELTEAFSREFQRGGTSLQSSFQSRDHRLARGGSLLWTLLSGRHGMVGALALLSQRPRSWSRDELQWLDIFAKVISIALENISLFYDLADEKNQLQLLIDNMPEGVFTTDRDGRVLTWNDAGGKVTDWHAEDIVGRPCSAFLQCQTVDGVWCATQCPLKLAMDGQKRWDSGLNNVFMVRRDGSKVPVFITAAPVGEETGAILVFRDITKEKEIEQVKEDFLATITHDLKSPLSSIVGYTELLRHPRVGTLGETQLEFLEAITRSSKTLQILIDNILESTRMESGQMVYNPTSFGLGALLEELREMFVPLVGPKHLQMIFQPEADIQIFADREKIKEVFVNLLSNSVKFTRDHGHIKIGTEAMPGAEQVRIILEDSGKGIPPDQLHRLFLKFSQVKGERGGTGLGLYIVKKILEAHGQTVHVTSTQGVGTTFTFTLPLFVVLKPTVPTPS
ncbi:MAG TPA: ATP-binding protein [Candidatus Xenobia bacterium]|jgi:PAS domain S-box-containing protein